MLYIGGVVVATVLEFITGWLMETIFHTRWWDYSQKNSTFMGISVSVLPLPGVSSRFFLLFKVLQPFVEWLTDLYPVSVGKIASAAAILYGVDFVTSAVAAFGISKRLARLEDMLEDLTAYLQTTRLYETKEEIRDKLEEIRAFNLADAAEKIGIKKVEFSKLLRSAFLFLRIIWKRRRNWRGAWMNSQRNIYARKKSNIVGKRMIHAYPGLRAEFRRYKERKAKKH